MITRIFVVRHGETEGNLNKIYRGRWDLPLNRTGEQQVDRAGRALESIELAAIYQSPLQRTRQTAEALARHRDLAPLDEESLIDIDYGRWTKVPDAQVAREQAELYRLWKTAPQQVRFPDGEGLAEVRARVEPALKRLCQEHPGQSIALASHRVPIKLLVCVALGLDDSAFWKIQIDPASISVLDCREGDFSLVLCNESCHLKPLADKLKTQDF